MFNVQLFNVAPWKNDLITGSHGFINSSSGISTNPPSSNVISTPRLNFKVPFKKPFVFVSVFTLVKSMHCNVYMIALHYREGLIPL